MSKPNIKAIRRHGEEEHGKELGNSGGEGSQGQPGGPLTKCCYKGSEGKWKKNLPERRFSKCKGPDGA